MAARVAEARQARIPTAASAGRNRACGVRRGRLRGDDRPFLARAMGAAPTERLIAVAFSMLFVRGAVHFTVVRSPEPAVYLDMVHLPRWRGDECFMGSQT